MVQLLLKLLGAHGSSLSGWSGHIVDASLELRGLHLIIWVLFMAAALGWLAWWTYRRVEDIAPARRVTLITLRAVFLFLLLAMLLRPALVITVEGSARRTLCLLIDGSASMAIADPRVDREDHARQAI